MDLKKTINCGVLVVGGGNTGLVAAIEAKNRGADVLLIEKAPKKARGGNSRLSGGLFRVPGEGNKDYLPLVEAAALPKGEIDIEPYSRDDFYSRVIRLSDGRSDQRLTEIFVNQSMETVKWMKEQGVRWELNPLHMSKVGERLLWPSGQIVLVASGSGEGLVEMEYGVVEKKEIPVLYETAGRSLVIDEGGRVTGVRAKGPEGFFEIRAGSVILSCGGFQANPAWRRRYLGENWDLVKLEGNTLRYRRWDTNGPSGRRSTGRPLGRVPCIHRQ